MGNRLSRITTRTGDDGTTGLAGQTRVAKNHPRIAALGEVDELNSQIGLFLCEALPEDIRTLLVQVQHQLFDLGGTLAMPEFAGITEAKCAMLDEALIHHNASLPPLKEFVLPGGTRAAALSHVCRTVCRRAERQLVTLAQQEPLDPMLVQYLNRLSDLLFVIARVLNQGQAEPQWQPGD